MRRHLEKIFASNKIIAFALRKSKSIYLPGFRGLPLYDVIEFFHRQVKINGLAERAAAISFNFIMAVPPSLLFLFSLIPHLPFISMGNLKIQLHSIIFDIIPNREYNGELIRFVDSFIEGTRLGLLSFGLLLSLFFASNAMMRLMRAFNKKYAGFERKKWVYRRWMAIKLTILMFGLLMLYFVLLIMQGKLLALVVESSGWREVISYARWVLMVLLVFFAIAFIYKYVPAIEKRWKLLSPGTVLATSLSILASLGFSVYVNNFGRYNALYGSIGTVMVFMALVYINSLVLLIGFELNVSINLLKSKINPPPELPEQ